MDEIKNKENRMFKDVEFKAVHYVMDNLPSSLSMDYLVESSSFYKEFADAVERTFKKKLLDNSHSFIVGMQQIQDVKLDLHLTNVLCRNARRSLNESDKNLVYKCFDVISIYQRRKRMVDTLKILQQIQTLNNIEKEFHRFLDHNDFLNAISFYHQIQHKIMGEYKGLQCLELMRKRFRDGTKIITNKLCKEFISLIYDAPNLQHHKLKIIFLCFYKLNKFHLINELLEKQCNKVLYIKCTQIICKHLGYNRSFIQRNY